MTLQNPSWDRLPDMNSLAVFHRPKDQDGFLDTGVGPIWATCLREISFSSEEELSQMPRLDVKGIEVHTGREAFSFLVQILCGLRSPVLGETEVMGQFKAYLTSLDERHPLKRDPTTIPFLFNTVKEARTNFLSATGSLTYGQIVRRWLKEEASVTLWGFGSLGSEIYPWIKEKTSAVVVRTNREATEGVPFVVEFTESTDAHVIAAPLEDALVSRLAKDAVIVDLRDRPLQGLSGLKNLGDLFREIREIRKEREEILPRCEDFLKKRVDEYMCRSQIRPFGWEDLCG